MISRLITLIALLLCTSTLSDAQDLIKGSFRHDAFTNYEAFWQKRFDTGLAPGAVTLIYRKGEIAYHQALGYNNLESRETMTKDKIFYIQSMTKPIISTAVMTLYEKGLFSLDDPVSMYLPEFADLRVLSVQRDEIGQVMSVDTVGLNQPMRIWHLLTHSAGLSHGLGANRYEQELFKKLYQTPHQDIRSRVDALISMPLIGQPGEQWYYSAAPDVLALLIEQWSGMNCAEYLQQTIFDPLGMNQTGYNVPVEHHSRVVGLHQMDEHGALKPVPQWNPLTGNTIYGGTHGLYSTPEDYLKFGRMLLGKGLLDGTRIISRKTWELMAEDFMDYLPADLRRPGEGFGLGLGITTDISDSKRTGSHGTLYWSGAFNTFFFVDIEEDMVAIMMMQYWPYSGDNGNMLRQLIYSGIGD